MVELLSIRDAICSFYAKNNRIINPIIKFIYAVVTLSTYKLLFGYNDSLYKTTYVIGIGFIAAFIPTGITYLIVNLISCVDVMSLSLEVAIFLAASYAVIYLLYLRLVPGKSYIVLLTLILCVKIPCAVPIVVAAMVGPVGIVPVICGLYLFYFSIHARELEPLINASTDNITGSNLPYLINNMVSDQEMLLYIIAFSIVIMVTYLVYKSSLKYAWYIALSSGAALLIIILMAGGVAIDDTALDIPATIIGSVLSAVVALVIQFFKGIVDYSRLEVVQFEDDEYYYYVKAVPKFSIGEKQINVTKINERK